MNLPCPWSNHVPIDDHTTDSDNDTKHDRPSGGSKPTGHHPMVADGKDQNVTNEQNAGQQQCGQQIRPANAVTSGLNLIVDELITFRVFTGRSDCCGHCSSLKMRFTRHHHT